MLFSCKSGASLCAALAVGASVYAAPPQMMPPNMGMEPEPLPVAVMRVITVDDDRAQLSTAEFTDIQSAVNAAVNGDVIRVYAGRYSGGIVVNKQVDINGDPNTFVSNNGAGGFEITANNVKIDGFRIQGNTSSSAYPNAGIYVRVGSGRTLSNNSFESNGLGIYTEGAQQNLLVTLNTFIGNRRLVNTTAPSGGIYTFGGVLTTAEFSSNIFANNSQFCLNISGNSRVFSTGVRVTGNSADGDRSLLVIGQTQDAVVTNNTTTNLSGAGILCFGDNDSMLIRSNSLRSSGGNFIGLRFAKLFGANAGNTNMTVDRNTVTGFGLDGISLADTQNATVSANTVTENRRHGLRLLDADTSFISGNIIRGNAADGLRADSASTGNNIVSNNAENNTGLDCSDYSIGNRTAGTANTWENNGGFDDNKGGALCRGSS